MNTAAQQLDARDEALVALVVAGRTVSQAAGELGIAPSTAYRRLRSPAVRLALGEARAAQWQPSADRLRAEVSRSIDRIVTLRDDPNAHPSTQLRASVALIELATKLHELVDTHPRLAAIESQLTAAEDDSTDA